MGNIRILDEHIANQIAAGEVVERPSSVVKELVENSIDAGSTRIDVTIEEGGLRLIRITDNGSGMEPDDCETAFYRHATSKIATSRDLFQIRTLGFRGEALPSIAAVAKVECVSSARSDGLGRRLVIEGGAVRLVEDAAAPRGTDISVKDLFYNTPARLKYMKTIQTELGHVSDYLYRMALAYPQVAFSLKHNGNLIFRTPGNGDLLQVIAAVYGTSVAKAMLPLKAESLDYAIGGYISRPELTRASRSAISTIINGRYIRNYALVHALLAAYHTLLPVNRFPVAVVRIDMDPTLVDVNVHPAKLEVRFSKEAELLQFVESEAKRALKRQVLIPQMPGKSAAKPAVVQEQLELYGGTGAVGARSAGAPAGAPSAAGGHHSGGRDEAPGAALTGRLHGDAAADAYSALRAAPGAAAAPAPRAAAPRESEPAGLAGGTGAGGMRSADSPAGAPSAAGGHHSGGRDEASDAFRRGDGQQSPAAAPSAGPASPTSAAAERRAPAASPSAPAGSWRPHQAARRPGAANTPGAAGKQAADWLAGSAAGETAAALPAFPRLTPVGQVHGTYIVAQNEDGLFLIDQHAAHERINYEWYYEKFGNPAPASQELLVPITLEFTPTDAERIRGSLSLFEQVGVFMEHFGGQTFLVRACPHWFPQGEEKQIIEEMAEWVLAEKKAVDLSKLREKSAIVCSCKASIKANQNLTLPEIEALLERLGRCRNPYTCPHGRPIVVSFSNYELEKMFKRVM